MHTWNVDYLFTRLGGTPGVLAHCAKYAPLSIPPTPNTVGMWKVRKRISAEWLPVIIMGLLDIFWEAGRPAADYTHLFHVRPVLSLSLDGAVTGRTKDPALPSAEPVTDWTKDWGAGQ